MRTVQPRGTKGSLKWIQTLVEQRPDLLNASLVTVGAAPRKCDINWLSPRKADDWAEYRDGSLLDLLQLSDLRSELRAFWPTRGPQWDAVARDIQGTVYLIEAKAHAGELRSSCSAKSPASLAKIRSSLRQTKKLLGVAGGADWLKGYYQYANRLAFQTFLSRNGVECRLVFLYFVGDAEVSGPRTKSEWMPVIREAKAALSLQPDVWTLGAFDVFVDVGELRAC